MSRPAPEIIMETTDDQGQLWQVIVSPSVYVVTYADKPVQLRVADPMWPGQYVYKKMGYSTQGSAARQARKLNERFDTDQFGILEAEA